MATVNLIDVSKHVGKTAILDAINISIQKGEFMVVVGPSGCGKSTLLRLIAGLEEPTSGIIQINDQSVNHIPAAKRDMAMVFQNYALYPHMTVFDNMAYGLKMRRFSKRDMKKRVEDVATLLQLTPYLQRKPQALSGGQKQRVAMGRAMVRSPAVFLFDEPLSNLDAKLRAEMRHEIKRLHRTFNTTSLYVTHDQTEAMTMAERVLVLNQGKVEQIGTPHDLYNHPETLFVAGFTGHYPINFISGHFNKSKKTIETELAVDYPLDSIIWDIKDKDDLTLAIRAEHVLICSEKSPHAIELIVEFIDDMGADKLIQAQCVANGKRLNLRVSAEQNFPQERLYVELPKAKLHVFHQQSGKRIGE